MERIKELREALGLNIADFSRQLNIPRSTLVGWEEGKSVSIGILKSLEEKFNIDLNWFLTGNGEMFRKTETKSRLEQVINETIATHPKFVDIEKRLTRLEASVNGGRRYEAAESGDGYTSDPEPEYDDYKRIPYVEDVAAGPPIAQSEAGGLTIRVPAGYVRENDGEYYAAGVQGESMTGAGIPDRCAVLIRRTDIPRDNAIQVVAWRGKSTLKRLREKEGGGWELRFEDGSNRAIAVDSGEYQVQGDFVAVLPPGCRIE
ncbi:MAG: helix-turn-helix domain-containing protein [Treponema sp.]|jgi:SOS-response transcriptional repressor LexA|nr:helix-turn-helix domain-containing protein [Treponema sp.]